MIAKDIVLISISKLLKEKEWMTLHLIFLSYLHYSLKCYGLGTMPVTLPAFTSAILVSGVIYGLFNASIGASLRDVSDAASGGGGMSTMKMVGLSLGIIASIICVVLISLFTKRELERMKKELEEADGNASIDDDIEKGPSNNRAFVKAPDQANADDRPRSDPQEVVDPACCVPANPRIHRLSKVVPAPREQAGEQAGEQAHGEDDVDSDKK